MQKNTNQKHDVGIQPGVPFLGVCEKTRFHAGDLDLPLMLLLLLLLPLQ